MIHALTLRGGDMIHTVADLMQISEMLVKSGMLPQSIRTKEAAAVIILKGREIGMPMMESFSLINVIQGKPTIAPQGMIALARRTREFEDMTISDDGETCTVTVKRKGQSPFVTKFSAKDAAAMQLAGKDNWQKQPKVMRQWRAVAANFRITFPDVIGGMYTPEELGAIVDEDGEVIEGAAVEIPRNPEPTRAETDEPVTRETKIKQLRAVYVQESNLLAQRGQSPKQLTKEQVDALDDTELDALIQQKESNVLDLRAAMSGAGR